MVDAIKERDVAIVDILGTFMKADTEKETIHMKLEGMMVNILTKLYPKLYRKYIRTEGNKPIMYVELKKYLYGMIQAALLFATRMKFWNQSI